MVTTKLDLNGKSVTIKGGRDTVSKLRYDIMKPFSVTQRLRDGNMETYSLFGIQWNWGMMPEATHTEYTRELNEYVAKIHEEVTARTVLPSTQWSEKYVPTKEQIDAIKAKKSI